MPPMIEIITSVSFAATPITEMGTKANAILALGWEPRDRGDPWAVEFAKKFEEGVSDPEAELREVMGDYWLGAHEIRELLDK
jgi:hypothetical protein